MLSVYHNRLMGSFDDVRDFLDYMTGQRVPIWDIPAAMRLVRASLDQQCEWLHRFAVDPEAKPDSFPKFIRQMAAVNGGDTMTITPLKPTAFKPTTGL